jgi:hypothetical protein
VVRQGKPDALLAGYPLRLYRIASSSTTLTVPKGVPYPQGVTLLYPEGGAIHAAVADKEIPDNGVRSLLMPLFPKAERVEPAGPKIEDLFIFLLSQEENAQ